MQTLLFISGKNWILSLAELVEYFRARNIFFKIEYFSREFFVLTFQKDIKSTIIDDLGGTLKIGEVKSKLLTKELKEVFLEKNKQAQKQILEILAPKSFFDGINKSSSKILFGVSVYFTDNSFHQVSGRIQRFVGKAIKEYFNSQGKKANFIGYAQNRKTQLSHVEVIKKKLVEKQAEILLCIGKRETWIALTKAVHNPFEFQKRDVYKPNQRAIFGVPPRIARIMVNLSACTQEKTLLDSFCGVGTILQEALLEGADVVGVDINPWCVKATNENLQWLSNEYKILKSNFRVIQGNIDRLVEKIGVESIDCIVSEPDLGPALRDIPTLTYAEKIIKKLQPLFYRFVEQAYKVLKTDGRLVLVTPYIRTRSGRNVAMPIDEEVENCGFKRVRVFSNDIFQTELNVGRLIGTASLIEIDDHHKIGREIHVFQK